MNRKLLYVWGLLGLFIFVAVGWGFLLSQDKQNLSVSWGKEDLIRLHVLANSDSPSDQQLKLKVRDAIIAYLAPYLEHTATKADAKQLVLEHKDQLTDVAAQTLTMNGADYPVNIQIGLFDFPIKSYGSLVLPAGKYEAVRVLVGNAEGKNWWCVLFPPLCFVDITNASAIPAKKSADNAEQQAVTVEFRSKLAELWRENINL
ncbi:MAG: stage II sporulation protein R [Sporomusaceae bacterium]|nr:stage II sporulation protein R [Sporomusaceae bacterium]